MHIIALDEVTFSFASRYTGFIAGLGSRKRGWTDKKKKKKAEETGTKPKAGPAAKNINVRPPVSYRSKGWERERQRETETWGSVTDPDEEFVSFHPEHDIEVGLDVKIDNDDIANINQVSIGVSLSLLYASPLRLFDQEAELISNFYRSVSRSTGC